METRTELLQNMIKTLRLKGLCEKVYVAANSPFFERDNDSTSVASTIMDKLRHEDGDMQGIYKVFFCYSTVLTTSLDYFFFRYRSRHVCRND